MAFDCFIKIDGIDGESTDEKHKNQIEVLSFSWGVSQAGTASHSSSGAVSGERANFSDFNFMKLMDLASAPLAQACASGKHIKDALITLSRATESKSEYWRYHLEDIIVSSLQHAGAGGGEPVPSESCSLNYGKVTFGYAKLDKAGVKKDNRKGGWNLQENKIYTSSKGDVGS